MTDESLINKVRALLAKAERTDSEAERDAFNAKAAELIAKYEIDMAALQPAAVQREICKRTFDVDEPFGLARMGLLCDLGRVFSCSSFYSRSWKYDASYQNKKRITRVTMYGTEDSLHAVEALYASLSIQAIAGASKVRSIDSGNTKSARIGFINGFSNTVTNRLRAARRQAIDSAPDVRLVLISDAERANALMRAENRLTSGTRTAGSAAGRAAGAAAGQRADIGHGRVAGSSGPLALGK